MAINENEKYTQGFSTAKTQMRFGLMFTSLCLFFAKLKIQIRLMFNRSKKISKELVSVYEFMNEHGIHSFDDLKNQLMNILSYKSDGLIDWQQLAYETIRKGHGDCEDIHRVVQLIIYNLLNLKNSVYLVQTIVKPLNKSHAFVIYTEDNSSFYVYDYTDTYGPYVSLYDAANGLMLNKYSVQKVLGYVVTDPYWRFVEIRRFD